MPRRNNNQQIKRIQFSNACEQKRRYNTQNIAESAAEDGMLRDMSLELSVYRCDYCSGWHLTSGSRKSSQE